MKRKLLVQANARIAVLESEPRVTCVAFDSSGKPMPSVHLLGDAEATRAVTGLRDERDALKAENARLVEAAEQAQRDVERLGPKVSCSHATGKGTNCGECLDCVRVHFFFANEAFERERSRAEVEESRLRTAETALRELWDYTLRLEQAFTPFVATRSYARFPEAEEGLKDRVESVLAAKAAS